MAKLLLIEKDQISAALLEDRLRVAGHQVEMLFDATRAASRVDEHQIDLVVLDVPGESAAALALIAELRNRPGTRAVSIVALSDSPEPAHRMDVLRAGADDCLIRPFDPEELELRVKRLLGSRTAGLHLLQGDLVSHPLWAVLQYLQQVNKTGHLKVRGAAGSGTIDLSGGELVAARWQGLRGKEALLTLLSIEEGSFRVDPGEPVGEPSRDLPMNELLMRAAWLKDELAKRRQFLPFTGEPLTAGGKELGDEPEFGNLPLRRLLSRIRGQRGTRLFDLIMDEAEAPLTTRVALAWLVENGYVATGEQAPGMAPQNTMEISSAILLEVGIAELIAAAAAAGLPAEALPYLALVEPEAWPELRRLFEEVPGYATHPELRKLVEQVEARRAGSATFSGAGGGKLALHVQILAAGPQPQLAAIVPGCAGVLLWLTGAKAPEGALSAVQRLDASGLAATGLVVATTPAAQRAAAELLQGSRKWRSSPHAPQSLLGLLRLLQPRKAR
ncbi:MAG TPA: hypothetical protein DD490_33480 [Acidobacteria bacterium]|nr:hypothetical protein [Acidobacteriota bacterium]